MLHLCTSSWWKTAVKIDREYWSVREVRVLTKKPKFVRRRKRTAETGNGLAELKLVVAGSGTVYTAGAAGSLDESYWGLCTFLWLCHSVAAELTIRGSVPRGGKGPVSSWKRQDRLGSTQHPVQWLPGVLSPGINCTSDLHILLRLKISGVIPLLLLYVVMAWKVADLVFITLNVPWNPKYLFVWTCGNWNHRRKFQQSMQ